jgi:hypothetical protein
MGKQSRFIDMITIEVCVVERLQNKPLKPQGYVADDRSPSTPIDDSPRVSGMGRTTAH